VIGANAPKPPRASKRTASGYEGSFCDKDKVTQLRADGYRITRGKSRTPRSTNLSTAYYILINGIKYAWNSPNAASTPSSLSTANVKPATASDKCVFGASFPKPPRMAIETGEGDAGGKYSTFVDPDKVDDLAQAGWIPVENGTYSITDFKTLI